jgi:hypothetical protein
MSSVREQAESLKQDALLELQRTTVTDYSRQEAPFSWFWVGATLFAFTLCNTLVARVFTHGSLHGALLAEALANLSTYFLGGLLVGLISPRPRTLEIGLGGALAVLLVMFVGAWLPVSFLHASWTKALLMAALAASVAVGGADTAGRWKGRAS